MKNIISKIQNNDYVYNLWDIENCQVAVNYLIYNKKRNRIISFGSSRVCGINHHKKTIHAEELAIKYCVAKINNKKEYNNYQIIIWRFDKYKNIKPVNCCKKCTKLILKYNFKNKIFTIDNYKLKSSIIKNPILSIGDKKRKKSYII